MDKSISKEQLYNLPLEWFKGEIVVIDYERDAKKVINILKKATVLGFDTETRPSFKKGERNDVALLQLSTEKTAFIFRLNKMGLPDCLKEILSDSKIIKAGAAIRDDIIALKNLSNFTHRAFVEIQDLAKNLEFENLGLKKLSGLLLGFRISKAQQTSNWEAEQLSESQIKYAATDAWVSLKIHNKLTTLKQNN